jgi:hypothetical protein
MNTYWLNVPQEEADKAKALRCKWDADKRRWWKPRNISIMNIPEEWLPIDLVGKNIYTRGRIGRKAALKATCVRVWDSELNIVYPSMKCAQEELKLTYKQLNDLCAIGTRYKKI